jgi:Na+/H+ antiporter
MSVATAVFFALLLIAAFAVIARVLRQPYPIVMVIGGALIALIPGLPEIHLNPDIVFLVILPPLLFVGGWTTDAREFKLYLTPILYLSLGLVIVTTVVVAFFAHWLIGLPLAAAFVLGAVLSPPDAIATEAIADEVSLPRATAAILSGESLVNDATALVIYRFAIAAVVTGTFSLFSATLQFFYVAIGGVAIGLVLAEGIAWVQTRVKQSKYADDTVSTIFSIVTPFLVYLPAEALHASGVLATVTAGVALGRRSGTLFTSQSRIAALHVWELLIFVLNGAAFLLIGLQLRTILHGLRSYPPQTLVLYALSTCAVLVAVRFAMVFSVTYLRLKLDRKSFGQTPPTWKTMLITSWAGMRGLITLAVALAIPATTATGEAFPGRSLILFLAFSTIVITLVGQGITLPFLIRGLAIVDPISDDDALVRARLRTALAARERLRELESEFTTTHEWEIAGRMIGALDDRIGHFGALESGAEDAHSRTPERGKRLQLEMYAAERKALEGMRASGEISDRVYSEIGWEIDLSEARLA